LADIIKIGLLSDTHGSLPGWVFHFFKDQKVDAIIHAGDVVGKNVISDLESIASVTQVRGNMDYSETGPATAVFTSPQFNAYILHNIDFLDLDPAAAGMNAVIYGHTHRPSIEWRSGILYFNPGSPCSPRGDFENSVGIITVSSSGIIPEIRFENTV
jgi:putative phosphoesterase